MPVPDTWTCVDRLAGAESDYGPIFDLCVGEAFLDEDNLARFVAMPLGSSAGLEPGEGDCRLELLIEHGDSSRDRSATDDVRALLLLSMHEP